MSVIINVEGSLTREEIARKVKKVVGLDFDLGFNDTITHPKSIRTVEIDTFGYQIIMENDKGHECFRERISSDTGIAYYNEESEFYVINLTYCHKDSLEENDYDISDYMIVKIHSHYNQDIEDKQTKEYHLFISDDGRFFYENQFGNYNCFDSIQEILDFLED